MSQTGRAGATSLIRLLYISDLSPGTRATEVSRIVGPSRRRNAEDAITVNRWELVNYFLEDKY